MSLRRGQQARLHLGSWEGQDGKGQLWWRLGRCCHGGAREALCPAPVSVTAAPGPEGLLSAILSGFLLARPPLEPHRAMSAASPRSGLWCCWKAERHLGHPIYHHHHPICCEALGSVHLASPPGDSHLPAGFGDSDSCSARPDRAVRTVRLWSALASEPLSPHAPSARAILLSVSFLHIIKNESLV